MKKMYKAVNDYIVTHAVYDNPHQVEILAHSDDSITVTSGWPGESGDGDIYLEIFYESNNMAEFYRVFGIRSVDDLTQITQEFLLYLYKQGQAVVSCAIDTINTFYSLQFRKQNNTIRATDYCDRKHTLTVLLETPQQFMDYTRQHYLLHQ